MKDFKFFEKERIFTEYMDRMDDYFLGNIQFPPLGISHRHWNMLPQDVRNRRPNDVLIYVEGFEAARMGRLTNPYVDTYPRDLWKEGYDFYRRRFLTNQIGPR